MDDINQKNNNTTNSDDVDQKQYNEIVDLINKAKDLTNEFSKSGEDRSKRLADMDEKIDKNLSEVETLFREMDEIDQKTNSDLDSLILNQIKDLSTNEEEED